MSLFIVFLYNSTLRGLPVHLRYVEHVYTHALSHTIRAVLHKQGQGHLIGFSVIVDCLLYQLLHKLCVFPNSRYFPVTPDQDSFAILDVVPELADVNAAIWVYLLAMLIADTVFEVTCNFSSIVECVGPIACHC